MNDLLNVDVKNELAHYGILGMKWGVRRNRGPDGTVGSKKKMSADDKAKERMRKDVKNRRQLSDDELMKKIARIEKEKKLRELTDAEINSGKKASSDILKSAGTKVATAVVSGAALYGLKAVLTGKVDPVDLAGYVAPKPGKK